jgi:glycosyltransferase involved in cell wall biosynthesis
MEDWYSEDLTPEEMIHFPADALRQYEREALRGATFATTTSCRMSEALTTAYDCEPPKVVYNSFPWADRVSIDGRHLDRRDLSLPSVHWFSQVIGPMRGLETLVDALPYVQVRGEIHLRGRMDPGYGDFLMQRAPEEWRSRIHFHDQVPHSELISRIAEHDIGLALEIPHTRSKALTLANKLPLYLLAGLPVAASDTDGQREAAALAPGAVFLFPAGDASALATLLDTLLNDPALRVAARLKAVAAAKEVFSWERSAAVIVGEVDRLFSAGRVTDQTLAPTVP